jgi:hypothetical protein
MHAIKWIRSDPRATKRTRPDSCASAVSCSICCSSAWCRRGGRSPGSTKALASPSYLQSAGPASHAYAAQPRQPGSAQVTLLGYQRGPRADLDGGPVALSRPATRGRPLAPRPNGLALERGSSLGLLARSLAES